MTDEIKDNSPTTRDELVDYLTGEFKNSVLRLPEEILCMTIDELEANRPMSLLDYNLRKNLWDQIAIARKVPGHIIYPSDVYNKVMTSQGFQRVIKNPYRVAWLMINPRTNAEKMAVQLNYGLERLGNEVLTMALNEKTYGHFLKAIEILLNRVEGPMLQRIQQTNLNANLNMNKPVEISNPTEAIARLDELKGKLINEREVGPVKEVSEIIEE